MVKVASGKIQCLNWTNGMTLRGKNVKTARPFISPQKNRKRWIHDFHKVEQI